jgi:hypothetical protein
VKARERCLFPTVVHHETHCSIKSYSARHIVSRESYGADRRDGWRCDLWRLRICLPNTTHLIILPDARAFPAPSMPRTLPAAVPSAYPMLRLNGGSDGLEPSTTGVEVASELWRTLGCNDLNGPHLARPRHVKPSSRPQQNPASPAGHRGPRALGHAHSHTTWSVGRAIDCSCYLCIQGVELGVIYERLPEPSFGVFPVVSSQSCIFWRIVVRQRTSVALGVGSSGPIATPNDPPSGPWVEGPP